LQGIVFILFAMGGANLMTMLLGCLFLRNLARSTPNYDGNIILKSPLVPGISIVLVLPDASSQSREFARQVVELHFGQHELVLVLDGPDGAEMEAWTKEFRLTLSARSASNDLRSAPIRGIYESSDPIRLVVVNKEATGEADALNAGVSVATSAIICLLDGLCQFDSRILLSLVRPMLDDPARTIGVCGFMPSEQDTGLMQANYGLESGSSWVARFGELESLRVWLARCAAFAKWNRLVPVPGASMLVWRDAIVKAGGFTGGPLDLFLALHRQAQASRKVYRIALVPDGASYARVPGSLDDLRQRAIADIRRIGKAMKRGHIGSIGWAVPGLFCQQWLRPLLETAAWILAVIGWLAGGVDLALVGLVLLATIGLGILTSMAAVVFRELVELRGSDPGRLSTLFLAGIPENLGYRQLRNLWLVAGLFASAPQKQNRG